MEHTAKLLTSYEEQLNNAASILPAPAENICFFDIETTGLSAAVSSLYLIGTITFENNKWVLNQWFADDYVSEVRLLQAFSEFSEKYEWIAHYNGATFDIPYLEKKYRTNHMPSPFAGKQTLDLYRAVKHIKKYFPVPNQKLITMERLAGFTRHELLSGKECITLYTEFMHENFFHNPESLEKKNRLLFHNEDDLIGTIVCALLLAYTTYKPICPSVQTTEHSVLFTDTLEKKVPANLSFQKGDISFSFEGKSLSIEVPLWEGTLYHFFADYKIIIICQRKIWRYIKALAVLSNLPTVRKQLPLTATSKRRQISSAAGWHRLGFSCFFAHPKRQESFYTMVRKYGTSN